MNRFIYAFLLGTISFSMNPLFAMEEDANPEEHTSVTRTQYSIHPTKKIKLIEEISSLIEESNSSKDGIVLVLDADETTIYTVYEDRRQDKPYHLIGNKEFLRGYREIFETAIGSMLPTKYEYEDDYKEPAENEFLQSCRWQQILYCNCFYSIQR